MIRRLVFLLLLGWPLVAQPPAKSGVSKQEQAIIARYRAFDKPRTPSPRSPLTAEERNTIRRFKEVKNSVVYITAVAQEVDPQTGEIHREPSSGTGFVWDAYGHVVTNHHVITAQGPEGQRQGEVSQVEVTLSDGKTYQGRVIGVSFAFDIAVLQVFAPLDAMSPIPIGTSAGLQVGQDVLAIGNPFGLDQSLSKGIVSALDRPIPTDYQTRVLKGIQTDAAINPGNSGGPLLDSSGRLVGMNTAIPAATGASVGIGFAIPVDTLNQIVPLLISRKQLEPPRMGFSVFSAYDAMQMGVRQGLVVDKVDPGTPAARAGLQGVTRDAQGQVARLGDVILAYQGLALKDEGQLAALLEVAPPANEVVFDVLRNGQVVKLHLNLKGPASPPAGI